MEIKDLKATAYDIMAQIQALQNKLGQVNQEIAQEFEKQKEEKPKKTHGINK